MKGKYALALKKTIIDYLRERPEQKFPARQFAELDFSSFPMMSNQKEDLVLLQTHR